VSDDLLWGLRTRNRKELVQYVRERLEHQDAVAGGSDDNTQRSRTRFDPDTLTLGFARGFATYKRPTLLLQHPDRLARILTNPKFPVQLVIAGKAHPADAPGKAMIKQWVEFVSRPEVRPHVVFIAD
jgi:glycogen phosphorylase